MYVSSQSEIYFSSKVSWLLDKVSGGFFVGLGALLPSELEDAILASLLDTVAVVARVAGQFSVLLGLDLEALIPHRCKKSFNSSLSSLPVKWWCLQEYITSSVGRPLSSGFHLHR